MFLHIKAKPGKRENKISVRADGIIEVKIKAPANDGKANEELISFFSEKLKISRSRIKIISGLSSPFKKIEIDAEENYVRKNLGLL